MNDEQRIQRAMDVAGEIWKFGFFSALENNGIVPVTNEQAAALLEIGQIKKAEFLQDILDDSTIGQIKRASAIERGRGYVYELPDEATCAVAAELLTDENVKQACADYGCIMHMEGLL